MISDKSGRTWPNLTRCRPNVAPFRPDLGDHIWATLDEFGRLRPKLGRCRTILARRRPSLGDFSRKWADFGYAWPGFGHMSAITTPSQGARLQMRCCGKPPAGMRDHMRARPPQKHPPMEPMQITSPSNGGRARRDHQLEQGHGFVGWPRFAPPSMRAARALLRVLAADGADSVGLLAGALQLARHAVELDRDCPPLRGDLDRGGAGALRKSLVELLASVYPP